MIHLLQFGLGFFPWYQSQGLETVFDCHVFFILKILHTVTHFCSDECFEVPSFGVSIKKTLFRVISITG